MTKRTSAPASSVAAAAHMRSYRAWLRAAGFRPVQIWLPDVRAPGFAEEARRQSLLASASAHEEDTLRFIEAAADFGDDGGSPME